MKKYKRVVSIGGHSLDAELMGGPLLLKLAKNGAHCTFAHVTQGRLEDPNASDTEKKEYLERLREQNKLVANSMGADCKSFDFLSSNMPSEAEFIDLIVNYLVDEKVDCVITHAAGTMHARHYFTHSTVTSAVKKLRAKGFEIDLLYGENCEDLVGFVPQLYVPVNQDEENEWFNALRKYELFNGKVNTVPYYAYYSTMLRIRQMESGCRTGCKAYMYASLIDYDI